MAYESPLTIADVVKDISANKYVLPSIQREFVWSTSQNPIMLLFQLHIILSQDKLSAGNAV